MSTITFLIIEVSLFVGLAAMLYCVLNMVQIDRERRQNRHQFKLEQRDLARWQEFNRRLLKLELLQSDKHHRRKHVIWQRSID